MTIDIYPDQMGNTLLKTTLVNKLATTPVDYAANEAVVVHGFWAQQKLIDWTPVGATPTQKLRLVFAAGDAQLSSLWLQDDTKYLQIESLVAAKAPGLYQNDDQQQSAIKVVQSAANKTGPQYITFLNPKAIGTPTYRYARTFSIEGYMGAGQINTNWPADIYMINPDFSWSYGDLATIYGGQNIAYINPVLREATTLADNTPGWANDHVDGIQITNVIPRNGGLKAAFPELANNYSGSGAFDVGAYILNARIYDSIIDLTTPGNYPHQGIIVGTTTGQVINGVIVDSPVIGWAPGNDPNVGWAGTGVVVAGAGTTNVLVRRPKIRRARGGVDVQNTCGPNCMAVGVDFDPGMAAYLP